jgi:NAD(P)-dependent dehydrogenase (short-subunit alcohol dehydrogenase family)
MSGDFTGRTVLVTGASRGIGRATARTFAERGARVAVHFGSNEAAAADTLASLHGDGHLTIRADMADAEAVRAAVEAVVRETGRLDVLVNNAGIDVEHRLASVGYDEWQEVWARTLAVNLIGAANASYCAARHMIEHGGGRIVNVSSRGAFRGEPNYPAYGASKAGLNALGQSLAAALGGFGIFVATVAPGYVETDMAREELEGPGGDAIRAQSPLGRVATAEEVALAVVFLASDGAEFTTGAILDVNGASYLRT